MTKSKKQSTQKSHKSGAIEQHKTSEIIILNQIELPKPVLRTIELNQRFPLEITSNVQDQIRYLCKNIWEVEWSGILFYDTEGEFGNSDFKCIAKYILPMNKGTQAYTEFETGSDVVEFLMENNEYLDCKQGLSHSHNLMSVYFSGQDNSELISNAPFHNYYLSIIVNNKNEMCAKIASIGKIEEATTRNFEYTGENGIKKQGTSNSTTKEDVVFLYNCDIILPSSLDSNFTDKVKYIIDQEAEKSKFSKLPLGSKTPYSDSWGTYRDTNRYNTTESNQIDMFEKDNYSTSSGSSHSTLIEGFVSTLIALDPLNNDSIDKSLRTVRKQFGTNKSAKNETEIKLYLKSVVENYDKLYMDYFDDPNKECYEDTFEEVVDIFEEFSIGNWISDELYIIFLSILEEKRLTAV